MNNSTTATATTETPASILTYTLDYSKAPISYEGNGIVVLCDELVLSFLDMSTTGYEVFGLTVQDLAIADFYIDHGFITPVRVFAVSARNMQREFDYADIAGYQDDITFEGF